MDSRLLCFHRWSRITTATAMTWGSHPAGVNRLALRQAPQAIDDEHGDNGGGQHPPQIEHQLGGIAAPVKEQKGSARVRKVITAITAMASTA